MRRWQQSCVVAVASLLIGALAWAQTDGTPAKATAAAAPLLTPPEHVRGVEQTFLTYPEWFLVFSPAEYAAFVRHAPPSQFPFLGHIGQFLSLIHI